GVAAEPAAVTEPAGAVGVDVQVRATLVVVERAAPDQGASAPAQLDAVAGDDVLDRVVALERGEVEAVLHGGPPCRIGSRGGSGCRLKEVAGQLAQEAGEPARLGAVTPTP